LTTPKSAVTVRADVTPDLAVVLALVALPFLGAAATPSAYRLLGERTAYFAAAVALACFGLVVRLWTGPTGTVGVEWIPSLDVALSFHVDGLSLLVSFLATGVGVLILTYSGGYMHGEPGQPKYYATLLAFMGSMLGVALAADLLALFVFWELTSLSSFLLIGHYTAEEPSRYAARKSMLVTVAGGLFMLVGFVLLAWAAGESAAFSGPTYSLTAMLQNAGAMRETLHATGLFVPVLLLLAVGAATKSAQVPFHVWLPNAMEAPTPVSAFLHSATMVKAGVYLVGRFRPLFVHEALGPLTDWTLLLSALGLLTMTVAAVLAVAATDIKELLAYSTASHLGLIVAGFGFANAVGAETGAFHVLNHASFKAALFLVAGIVAHEAGTRRMADLSGLRHDLPVTAAVATVASLSMAGLPPFNGFYSKELLFDAAYETAHQVGGAAWAFPVVAVLGSVFTFLYSVKFLTLFFGSRPDGLGEVHRPPLAMLLPALVLGGLVLAITASPGTFLELIVNDAYDSAVAGDAGGFSVYLPTYLSPPVVMSAVTVAAGAALFPVYGRLHDGIRAALRGPVRANWWYDGAVEGLTALSEWTVPRVQTGLLRTYAVWTFAGLSALALGGYAATGASLPSSLTPDLALPLAVVVLTAVVGAGAVARAPSHVAGVLMLSIVGFMVAIFYILANAPDLALTQLTVETLVLVIFLLVLNKLPAFYGEVGRFVAARDAALSALVGATVTASVLLSTAASPNDALARFLVERAGVPADHGPIFFDYGGGSNVVNVILVDFRAFDTTGEIAVVAMAALAVLTLVRMRDRGEAS
jgi:multicomponent Na+:H+ antiporter subunit A